MSISPYELRIGNWVYPNEENATAWQVKGIINEEMIDFGLSSFNGREQILASQLDPIPLTPEILLACGFKDNEQNNSFDIEIKNCGILSFDKDDYSALITGSLKELGFATNSLYKCVHQLQNLYFSLTGEELKINL